MLMKLKSETKLTDTFKYKKGGSTMTRLFLIPAI